MKLSLWTEHGVRFDIREGVDGPEILTRDMDFEDTWTTLQSIEVSVGKAAIITFPDSHVETTGSISRILVSTGVDEAVVCEPTS